MSSCKSGLNSLQAATHTLRLSLRTSGSSVGENSTVLINCVQVARVESKKNPFAFPAQSLPVQANVWSVFDIVSGSFVRLLSFRTMSRECFTRIYLKYMKVEPLCQKVKIIHDKSQKRKWPGLLKDLNMFVHPSSNSCANLFKHNPAFYGQSVRLVYGGNL